MDDGAATWPMDIEQLLAVVFRAEGYFVAILPDIERGREARAALQDAGISQDDLKLYSSDEIHDIHERYVDLRGIGAKVAGVFMDDDAGRDLYLEYAKGGRSALWVRLPEKADVPKVLRVLADLDYLHARYYGEEGVQDFHLG